MSWFSKRRDRLDAAVLKCLTDRVSDLAPIVICATTGYGYAAVYSSLARLEQQNRVTSRWVDGPYPRSRVYRAGGGPDIWMTMEERRL
jgi:hypothetical protein